MKVVVLEMRRALHRRAVRVLVGIAVLGCAVAGVVAYASSSGKTAAELHAGGETHPAVLADWWIQGADTGALGIAVLFLVLGGMFGGATVAGAEWRYGTVTTTLTWEPRRLRLHGARLAAAGILAGAIAAALQCLFLAALLPAVLANGSTAGTDAGWWWELAAVVARISVLTAGAAVLALSLATRGRNTAFALVTVFAWLLVVENLIRGLRPSLQPWLWAENVSIVYAWAHVDGVDSARAPVLALAAVVAYTAALTGVAAWAFQRRDVTGAT